MSKSRGAGPSCRRCSIRPAGERIGEVWFTDGADLPLLAKYIFTSERLSIQVHPDDEQARARGLPQGKSECWYILDAEPGATLGLGLKREMGKEELRAAALDGSIERADGLAAGCARAISSSFRQARSTRSARAFRCSNSSRMRT